MRASSIAFAVVTSLLLSGCDKLSLVDRKPSTSGLGGVGGGGGGADGSGRAASGGASGGASAGLPCDVQTLFVKYCASCHGATPTSGAPRSLVTYADLTRSDLINSSITEALAALQRIQNQQSPMPPPPSPAPTAAEITPLQNWIGSGYPTGSCGGTGGTTQTGGSGGGASGSPGGSGGGTGGSNQGGSGGIGGGTSSGGLPCDVQALLVNRCDSCHGTTPSGGAPRSLVTYANLTNMDPANPALTEAQVALQRMQSTTSPMPPTPASVATSAEIATLQNWISSGYPYGSCGGGGAGGTTQVGSGGSGGGGGNGGASQVGSGGQGGGADAGSSSLPCNVQTLLVGRCDSCHGTTPSGGAPRSLVTYANLTSTDPANPSLTEAQVAVQRMQSTTSPMPPVPASPATSAEIATLQDWINGGYPSGSCSGDAGVAPPDPLNAPPTCTSKTNWTGGTDGSGSMEPGQSCISCHARSGGEAPTFVIAGTLYPTGHEPDNCNGTSGTSGARVVVTGNNGSSVTLTPNSAGNFYSSTSLPPPYLAKVVNSAGSERVMSSTASSGDCNSCHTQNGANGAPGRITLP